MSGREIREKNYAAASRANSFEIEVPDCAIAGTMISIIGRYHLSRGKMCKIPTAKIFMHGHGQVARLQTMKSVFAEIDRLGGAEFLPEGRPEQPPMPIEERRSTRERDDRIR